MSPSGPGPKKKNVLQRSDSFPPQKYRPIKNDSFELEVENLKSLKNDSFNSDSVSSTSSVNTKKDIPKFIEDFLNFLGCQKISLFD